MSVTFGFFNSVDNDRLYDADDMSNYFEGYSTDGIFKSIGQGLEVVANEGMTVDVLTGRAIVKNKWVKNTNVLNLTIPTANATSPRYDAIILKLSKANRTITIEVKSGTPASTPAKPTININAEDKEMCLAYVYVGAGVTAITSANIEDTRADKSLCGYVTPLVGYHVSKTQRFETLTKRTSNISVGISNYNVDTDVLLVSVNGLILREETPNQAGEYIINTTTDTPSIDLRYALDSGNVVTFTVLRYEEM